MAATWWYTPCIIQHSRAFAFRLPQNVAAAVRFSSSRKPHLPRQSSHEQRSRIRHLTYWESFLVGDKREEKKRNEPNHVNDCERGGELFFFFFWRSFTEGTMRKPSLQVCMFRSENKIDTPTPLSLLKKEMKTERYRRAYFGAPHPSIRWEPTAQLYLLRDDKLSAPLGVFLFL